MFTNSTLSLRSRNRIYDIEYANYLAELVVRDYGTHYMDAGAILSQQDFPKTQRSHKIVSLGAAFKHNSSNSDATDFIYSRTHSQVVTIGGPAHPPFLCSNKSQLLATVCKWPWYKAIYEYALVVSAIGSNYFKWICKQSLATTKRKEKKFSVAIQKSEKIIQKYVYNTLLVFLGGGICYELGHQFQSFENCQDFSVWCRPQSG